jgi:hypothetical protein
MTDPFSSDFRQSDALLLLAQTFPRAYEGYVFLPASPIPLPYEYKDGELVHLFPEAIHRANSEIRTALPTNLTRTLFPRSSEILYEINPAIFDIDATKGIAGSTQSSLEQAIEEHGSLRDFFVRVEDEVYLKTLIYAQLYKELIEQLQPSEVHVFTKKSSFIYDKTLGRFKVGEFAKSLGIPFHVSDVMRNSLMSPFGELDPGAQRIFEGFFLSRSASRSFAIGREPTKLFSPQPAKQDLDLIVFNSCPHMEFYLCEDSELCRQKPLRPRQVCPYDYFEEFPETRRDALIARTQDRRFGFASGIADILRINSGRNFALKRSDGTWTTIQDEIGHSQVTPLPYAAFPKRVRHFRGSQFYARCDISRILQLAVKAFTSNAITEAGSAMHDLKNTAPCEDYQPYRLFERIGLPVTPYDEFCEKPIFHETPDGKVISGLPDMVLRYEGGIIVIDFKTSMMSSTGYRRQIVTYGLAINSVLPSERIIGINIMRQFDGYFGQDLSGKTRLRFEGLRRPLRFTGYSFSPSLDDPFVQDVHTEMDRFFSQREMILNSNAYFDELKGQKRESCETCLMKEHCSYENLK